MSAEAIVALKSLASVLGLRPGHPMMAVASRGAYQPSAASQFLIPDDQGFFSIVRPSIIESARAASVTLNCRPRLASRSSPA